MKDAHTLALRNLLREAKTAHSAFEAKYGPHEAWEDYYSYYIGARQAYFSAEEATRLADAYFDVPVPEALTGPMGRIIDFGVTSQRED